MPIRCLNCHEEFADLAEYMRHNATEHAIDEGVTFGPKTSKVVTGP